LHRANATLLLVLGLLACASDGPHAALGWSLGGEAHVFVADDRFARDLYRQLTHNKDLMDALEGRPLVAVDARNSSSVTVLSANGAAPARVTVARFHAPQTCGSPAIVTELVLAFPAGGAGGHSTPPSHVTVVALLDEPEFAGGVGPQRAPLTRAAARDLVNRVAQRAESVSRGTRAMLVRQLGVDPDQAADAGEVAPLGSRYAVGFRARYVTATSDTMLVTGVAATDVELRELSWVIRPQRVRLRGGMIRSSGGRSAVRYSVRGAVARTGGDMVLLLDEIADVSARDSRATAVDPATRRVIAAQPLALRCP
jgi:hypothetical protein